jgi:UPF0755 protein
MGFRYLSRFIWTLVGIAMVIGVIVVGVLIYSAFSFGQPVTSDPNTPAVTFAVKDGDTMNPVAERLEQQQLIRSAFWMETIARFSGKSSDLKSGNHILKANMSYNDILDELTTAPPFAQVKFTIIPGTRIQQMPATLQQQGLANLDETRFDQIALNGSPQNGDYDLYPWLAQRNSNSLEGYLLPETYDISVQPTSTMKVAGQLVTPTPTSDETQPEKAVINLMLKQFDTVVKKDDLINVAQQHGHSDFHEVVIIASIVEREAKVPAERATIASVYWNRVKQGMLLNADPTIQYAQGNASNGWWPQLNADLSTLGDLGGYNTYTVRGLPPTAIASSSEASLVAAAAPDDTKYLYFVLNCNGDGTHDFSQTLAEHNRKVAQYSGCNGSQ